MSGRRSVARLTHQVVLTAEFIIAVVVASLFFFGSTVSFDQPVWVLFAAMVVVWFVVYGVGHLVAETRGALSR